MRLLMVPLGTNSAASIPNISAAIFCNSAEISQMLQYVASKNVGVHAFILLNQLLSDLSVISDPSLLLLYASGGSKL